MGNAPKKQNEGPDPTADQGVSPAHDPHGTTPDGIPRGTGEFSPKGRPTDDREATETATQNIAKDQPPGPKDG